MARAVAVVGSGYMGGGIAQVLALAGARVGISDVSAKVAEKNLQRLIEESRDFVGAGLFPEGATETLQQNLWAAASIEEAVRSAEFVEEAVPESIEVKHATLARISAAADRDVVIGSNTSTISIGKLAVAVEYPERFLGIHFSNPAPFVPGVELIPHEGTGTTALETARAIVAEVGKESATVKDVTGFVLNRLQLALFKEAAQLVEDGVANEKDVDTIVRTTFGFRLPFFGPFAIADMAGLDVYKFCFDSLQTEFADRFATPRSLQELFDAGKLGSKTGSGYVNIPAESTPDLVAYRNRAYVLLQELIKELGPAPIE